MQYWQIFEVERQKALIWEMGVKPDLMYCKKVINSPEICIYWKQDWFRPVSRTAHGGWVLIKICTFSRKHFIANFGNRNRRNGKNCNINLVDQNWLFWKVDETFSQTFCPLQDSNFLYAMTRRNQGRRCRPKSFEVLKNFLDILEWRWRHWKLRHEDHHSQWTPLTKSSGGWIKL